MTQAWNNRIIGYGEEAPDQLLANPRNARIHPKAQQDALAGVLREVGIVQDVIVNQRTGFLLDGHLRVSLALREGQPSIPVKYVDLDDGEEALILATFDPISAAAATDPAALQALLADVHTDSAALQALIDELAADVGVPSVEPGDGGDDFDTTPQEGPTRAQLGDLWIIGGVHRLLVGDCTDPANVARLMGGERAALCFTSPPYNSKSELHGNDKFRGSFYLDKDVDAMTPEEYRAFSREVFFGIGLCVADDGNVCYNISYNKNNRDGYIFVAADAIEAGFNLYETIAWVKTGMPNPASTDVLTRNFEFVFLFNRGETYRTTKVKGEVRSNVWEINNAGAQQDNHKACFPLGLPERAIQDMTRQGDAVVDMFLGTGTTLIAAHRTGRRCYGMEISPRYADVILRRAEAEGLEVARVED